MIDVAQTDELAALRQWRRSFHRFPEPAWCEYRTTSLICAALAEAGFEIRIGEQLLSPSCLLYTSPSPRD